MVKSKLNGYDQEKDSVNSKNRVYLFGCFDYLST